MLLTTTHRVLLLPVVALAVTALTVSCGGDQDDGEDRVTGQDNRSIEQKAALPSDTPDRSTAVTPTPEAAAPAAGLTQNAADKAATVTGPPDTAALPPVMPAVGSYRVNAGETFFVNISLEGYAITGGSSVEIFYDPDILQAETIMLDPTVWEYAVLEGTIENNAGTISKITVSDHSGEQKSTPVVTVAFNARTSGSSDVTLRGSSMKTPASGRERPGSEQVSAQVEVR